MDALLSQVFSVINYESLLHHKFSIILLQVDLFSLANRAAKLQLLVADAGAAQGHQLVVS